MEIWIILAILFTILVAFLLTLYILYKLKTKSQGKEPAAYDQKIVRDYSVQWEIDQRDQKRMQQRPGGKQTGSLGLRNKQLDCFMNATLQCFLGMDEFCEGVLKEVINNDCSDDEAKSDEDLICKGRVLYEFKKFIEEYKARRLSAESTKPLREVFETLFPSHQQHDARQFIMELFEAIQSEKNSSNQQFISSGQKNHKEAWEEYRKVSSSIIDDFFIGMYETIIECQGCHTKVSVYEQFNHVPLPVTLNNSFKSFESFLSDFGQEYYSQFKCKECNDLKESSLIRKIVKYPKCIIFTFERLNPGNNTKISEFQDFPQSFVLPDPEKDQEDPGKLKFTLNSIVNHFGTLRNGHYTANSLRDNQWYKFDDEFAGCLSNKLVKSNEAYILFYKTESY